MKRYLDLFISFFVIGMFTFGGGLAMLPFIKKKVISKGWIDEGSWDGLVTISQLSPGAIAVNLANLIGYRVMGKRGSIASVIGMTLPSILVILVIALFLQNILLNPLVVGALKGILLSVSILFIYSFIDLAKPLRTNLWLLIWTVFTFLIVILNILNPIIAMGISIPCGILYSLIMIKRMPS
jgi:chromate transporter